MIEIVPNDGIDDKSSRQSRTHIKSSTTMGTSKINEFKDWRGKISEASLPEYINYFFSNNSVSNINCICSVRNNRLRRQNSASVASPQRPCTAASNFSKSRPESTGLLINDSHKEDTVINLYFIFDLYIQKY